MYPPLAASMDDPPQAQQCSHKVGAPISVHISNPLQTMTIDEKRSDSTHVPCNPLSVLLVGNSNTRGLAYRLRERGVESTSVLYSDASIQYISNRLGSLLRPNDPSPQNVVLHCTDVNVHSNEDEESVKNNVQELSQHALSIFPHARIWLSGLPYGRRLPFVLRSKIASVNSYLYELCASKERLSYLDNADLPVAKDNLHLTTKGKNLLATKIAQALHRQLVEPKYNNQVNVYPHRLRV